MFNLTLQPLTKTLLTRSLQQSTPLTLQQVRFAGHNKWSKIRHSKGAKDANRGAQFAKLGLEIISAVKSGGEDPKFNLRLSSLLDRAKSIDFPKKNLESAFKKGLGQSDAPMEEMLYQGYGPNGVSVIVETITDSKNRTVKAVRSILTRSGGSLTDIAWMYQKKGKIELTFNKEKIDNDGLMDLFIELDAEDFEVDMESQSATIICSFETLGKLAQSLKEKSEFDFKIESMEPYYQPNDFLQVDENTEEGEVISEFLNKLDNMEDVIRIHSNVKFSNEE